MGSVQKIDFQAISKDVEGLTTPNLKKAYRRLKSNSGRFRKLNLREPLDYIDFEVNLDNEINDLRQRIERGDYQPQRPFVHMSPKNNGVNRPTITLHIEDSILYRFCIEQIDKQIIKLTRQKNIRGGIMASPKSQPTDDEYYEKWFIDWMDHQRSVHNALRRKKYIATTDISAYFDNIDLDVLKELLRDSIKDKPNLLSLLFYFLDSAKLRYGYKTTLNTGLLQDDIDCSRLLAYFFLYPHDVRMIDFCNKTGADFFRYVDDMNFAVNSEIQAKQALRELTTSLRELGLLASIEKTEILAKDKALEEMLYKENEKITALEDRAIELIRTDKKLDKITKEIIGYYNTLSRGKASKKRNWIKLLRRFYNLGAYVGSDFLLKDLEGHLIRHPSLIAGRRITKYLLANQDSPRFEKSILNISDYLESEENLYPQVETEALELFCLIDTEKLTMKTQFTLINLSLNLGPGKVGKPSSAQSDFSRGIAMLLLYKLEDSMNESITDVFLKEELTEYPKKCAAMVSLTVRNKTKQDAVINKLRNDSSTSMKRLLSFTENMNKNKSRKIIEEYIAQTDYYILSKPIKVGRKKEKVIIIAPSVSIRQKILSDLVNIYG